MPKITKPAQCWHCNHYEFKKRKKGQKGSWAFCKVMGKWFKPNWDLSKINKCKKFE